MKEKWYVDALKPSKPVKIAFIILFIVFLLIPIYQCEWFQTHRGSVKITLPLILVPLFFYGSSCQNLYLTPLVNLIFPYLIAAFLILGLRRYKVLK